MKALAKILKKKRDEDVSAGQVGTRMESDSTESHDFKNDPHGLFVLYPDSEFETAGYASDVDIVAVHGLNGAARRTWTDPKSGLFWLEDILPDSFPNARIMTFGYDSGLLFSRSVAGIETFARDLLNRLRFLRQEAPTRPLVFIAHSLGGIVVNQALITAHDTEILYGDILTSTRGVLFMGTPHRGSEISSWAALLANIINIAALRQAIKTELLRTLDSSSRALHDISVKFIHRATSLKIMSFTEQQAEFSLRCLVVPEHSAIIGLPNEIVLPSNATHRGICRFPSRNQNYSLVESAIKEIAAARTDSIGNQAPGTSKNPVSSAWLHSATRSLSNSALTRIPARSTAKKKLKRIGAAVAVPPFRSRSAQSSSSTHGRSTHYSRPSSPGHPMEIESGMVTIQISGLRKELSLETYGKMNTFSSSIRLTGDTLVSDLCRLVKADQPDTKSNFHLEAASGNTGLISDVWIDIFTTPAEVTIASFFSRVFPRPIEVTTNCGKNQSQDTRKSTIAVGRHGKNDLEISLRRTVRVPENTKAYDLPPDLGPFPLFNTEQFSSELPTLMVKQGGLFLPMHQMEAVWINFDCFGGKYVLRPFVGGVNAISGEALKGGLTSVLQRLNSLGRTEQDYMVLPEQPWLDGIATEPGIVRQFVATPMLPDPVSGNRQTAHRPAGSGINGLDSNNAPAGASVEWQMTGRDEVGGLQLQLIPEFDLLDIQAGSAQNVCRGEVESRVYSKYTSSEPRFYDVLQTPEELGLETGDIIHLKSLHSRNDSRPKTIADLVKEASGFPNSDADVALQAVYSLEREESYTIAPYGLPATAITFRFGENDPFDTILAVVRDQLRRSDGLLYAKCFTENRVEVFFPIKTRRCLMFVKELPIYRPDGVSRFRGLMLIPDALKHRQGIDDRSTELCLVSAAGINQLPKRICRITKTYRRFWRERSSSAFYHLALSPDCTVAELRKEIGKFIGADITLYAIHSAFRLVEPDASRVFHGTEMPEFSLHYDAVRRFEGSNDMTISIEARKVPNGQRFTKAIHCRSEITLGDLLDHISADTPELFEIPEKVTMDGQEPKTSMQRIVLGVLHETKTLASLSITDGCHLSVSGRRRLGGPVVIQTLMGTELTLDCKSDDTVDDLKEKISARIGMPPDKQRLHLAGMQLEDGRTIADYEIHEGSKITMYLRLRGGGPEPRVTVTYEGARYAFDDVGTTISSLRLAILSKLGIHPESQLLTCNGNAITDNNATIPPLIELSIAQPHHPRALGIAAGGRVSQRIETDTHNPRIWDISNSKILTIQALDARSFKKVTKLEPPPTPLTAEKYAELGFPFYKLSQPGEESKGAGANGKWGSIKGAYETTAKNMTANSTEPTSSQGHQSPTEELGGSEPSFELPGSLSSGDLAQINNTGTVGIHEKSIDFPVVLLDVDDAWPKFESIAGMDQDFGWNDYDDDG